MASDVKYLEAWHIRNTGTGKKAKTFWTRIGVAWVNRDGSLNVELECFPIDGKVHLREPREKDREPGQEG